MKCLNCGKKILKGKYCSGACKQAAYRNRAVTTTVTDKVELETATVTPVTLEPETVTERFTDEQWSEILADLPAGASRPRTKPTAETASLSYPKLMAELYRAWYCKPAYAELVLRLLTWTDEQLEGYWLPAWRWNRRAG